MLHLTERIFYIFVYLGLIMGTWLFVYPFLSLYYYKRKLNRFIRINEDYTKKSWFTKHLKMLLSITMNKNSPFVINTFLTISVSLFIITFLMMHQSRNSYLLSIVISSFVAIIPYFLLQIKLHNIRISSSYEGEEILTELISQYKMNYLNMVEAIDHTIHYLKKQPYLKRAFVKLSLSIKQYKNIEELEEIINEFYYSIHTNWAMLLANNLYLSIAYGENVQEALEDILEDLKDLKRIHEKNKQYNHEAYMIIKYVATSVYIFSVYSMFSIFGFTIEKYILYQFETPLGQRFFFLTFISIVINYIIYLLIRKPKNDF